ncbi:hypothetical protein SKPI104516_17720 [Skermania piniformis]
MPYFGTVRQLSFFSADALPPAIPDLGGLLACAGQVVRQDIGARISVLVAAEWRAHAIAELISAAGLVAEVTVTTEGNLSVRTALVAELLPLGSQWQRGAVKSVPVGWVPGPRALRAWALAAGSPENGGERFVLGMDPHAPDTYPALTAALSRAGITPTPIGVRGPNPGLRIAGPRRLAKLVDYLGAPPVAAPAADCWPSG